MRSRSHAEGDPRRMNHKQIIWLASYPKSGSTWLRLFIEQYLLGKYDLNNLVSSISDNISTRYGAGVGEDVTKLPVDVQMQMRGVGLFRLVRMFQANRPHKDFPLLVKTHSANLIPNGVTMIPPAFTKSVVHIVRDPRSVAISFAKHLGVDIDTAIQYMGDDLRVLNSAGDMKMHDFLSSWRLHTKSFVEGDLVDTLTVRYEDMMSDGVPTFSKILDHVGIAVDPARVESSLEAVRLSKLRERERETGFIEASPKNKDGFFGQGGSKWHTLKPYQIKRLEKFAGPYMERFGYKGRLAA